MRTIRTVQLCAVILITSSLSLAGSAKKFEWTTDSKEAKQLLFDVQMRVENFQFGNEIIEAARKVVEADPEFAMGEYYLSAVMPPPDNQAHLDRAVELSKKASDGERRFIDAMVLIRADNGANFEAGIPLLEKLASDYPDERLVYVILGQLYQGTGENEKALTTYRKAQRIGPKSNRLRAFIANDDLAKGRYAEARQSYEKIEEDLPEGAAPFQIRYGTAVSYLYEKEVDKSLAVLEQSVTEYTESGANQNFPEVFIWNMIARVNLENGRLEAAMKGYQKGYECVPGSTLPDDQKEVWLGRLHHGKCRVLAKMGKYEEAWAQAETVRKMIEEGGEEGEQYLPAYHYLVGYLKLEEGDYKTALKHIEQADLTDPFMQLLLARAYEGLGEKEKAREAYEQVVGSSGAGLPRALSYPEAKEKLGTGS